jgi:hypothetical protein
MTLQIEFDPDWKVGDIIKVQGKNHRITKKTTTAVAVERYFWFDRLYDKWVRKHE